MTMKNTANKHQRGRNARVFEEHACGRGSASVRRRRNWRFYDGENSWRFLFDPHAHFRVAARALALDAKHMRSVRRPVSASHVKDV